MDAKKDVKIVKTEKISDFASSLPVTAHMDVDDVKTEVMRGYQRTGGDKQGEEESKKAAKKSKVQRNNTPVMGDEKTTETTANPGRSSTEFKGAQRATRARTGALATLREDTQLATRPGTNARSTLTSHKTLQITSRVRNDETLKDTAQITQSGKTTRPRRSTSASQDLANATSQAGERMALPTLQEDALSVISVGRPEAAGETRSPQDFSQSTSQFRTLQKRDERAGGAQGRRTRRGKASSRSPTRVEKLGPALPAAQETMRTATRLQKPGDSEASLALQGDSRREATMPKSAPETVRGRRSPIGESSEGVMREMTYRSRTPSPQEKRRLTSASIKGAPAKGKDEDSQTVKETRVKINQSGKEARVAESTAESSLQLDRMSEDLRAVPKEVSRTRIMKLVLTRCASTEENTIEEKVQEAGAGDASMTLMKEERKGKGKKGKQAKERVKEAVLKVELTNAQASIVEERKKREKKSKMEKAAEPCEASSSKAMVAAGAGARAAKMADDLEDLPLSERLETRSVAAPAPATAGGRRQTPFGFARVSMPSMSSIDSLQFSMGGGR